VREESYTVPKASSIPGSVEDWLNRAKSDLALAQIELPEGASYVGLCYHAQQAAEKAIKAISIHQGWNFQDVHNIAVLIRDLEMNGIPVPAEVKSSARLTECAHQTRYPGTSEPVTREEHEQALDRGRSDLRWAETVIAKPKPRS